MEKQHTILAVDDEESTLRALERLFRNDGYNVLTATSGDDGLAVLADERVSLIISAQRMPGMAGSDFLARAREAQPHALRILLTGTADLEVAAQAINEGQIWHYVAKPWDDEQLRLTVREALEHYDLAVANRRLTAQLQLKNRQLEEMNASLELKVRQRTHELALRIKELEGRDRIAQHMLTVHTLEETLDTLLDVTVDLLDLDRAVVYLSEAGGLTPAAGWGASEPGQRASRDALSRLPVGDDVAAALEALRAGLGDPDAAGGHDAPALVALRRGEELLGAIEIERLDEARPVGDDELAILRSLAVPAAIALHDARTHGDYAAWKGQIDSILASVDQLDDLLED